MKIVFFGTPDYVVPIIEKLHKEFKSDSGESPIAAVVTQAPKPSGRKQELLYSPVDSWAHKKKIPIYFDPTKIVSDNIDAQLGVVASYGKIIPKSVIDHFPHGILNIHPSLLPEFRGSSPVQATLLTGEQAGSTIIKIDEHMDHGPILTQFKDEATPDDTTVTLRTRLFERSAEVLVTLIPAYLVDKLKPRDQNHKKATFTRQIKKEDAFIPPEYVETAIHFHTVKDPVLQTQTKWQIPFITNYSLVPSSYRQSRPSFAYSLDCFIRAMTPWPGAWTLLHLSSSGQARRLKILKAHLETKEEMCDTKNGKPPLMSAVTYLVLDEVQLEGRGVVSWKQFKEGYPEAKFEK